jgi:hypothetical protein
VKGGAEAVWLNLFISGGLFWIILGSFGIDGHVAPLLINLAHCHCGSLKKRGVYIQSVVGFLIYY